MSSVICLSSDEEEKAEEKGHRIKQISKPVKCTTISVGDKKSCKTVIKEVEKLVKKKVNSEIVEHLKKNNIKVTPEFTQKIKVKNLKTLQTDDLVNKVKKSEITMTSPVSGKPVSNGACNKDSSVPKTTSTNESFTGVSNISISEVFSLAMVVKPDTENKAKPHMRRIATTSETIEKIPPLVKLSDVKNDNVSVINFNNTTKKRKTYERPLILKKNLPINNNGRKEYTAKFKKNNDGSKSKPIEIFEVSDDEEESTQEKKRLKTDPECSKAQPDDKKDVDMKIEENKKDIDDTKDSPAKANSEKNVNISKDADKSVTETKEKIIVKNITEKSTVDDSKKEISSSKKDDKENKTHEIEIIDLLDDDDELENKSSTVSVIKKASKTIEKDITYKDIKIEEKASTSNVEEETKNENTDIVILDDAPNTDIVVESLPSCSNADEINKIKSEAEKKFNKFIETCMSDKIKKDIVDALESRKQRYCKRFHEARDSYIMSEKFTQMLDKKTESVLKKPEKVIQYVTDVMNNFKENQDVTKICKDPITLKRIAKLEHTYKALEKKIKELDDQEIDINNDDENSAYIQSDVYKKRIVQIFKLLCELKGESKSTGSRTHAKLNVTNSKYSKINDAVNRLYNKNKVFPNMNDIEKCITNAVKKHDLNLSPIELEREVKTMFKHVGRILQNRRKSDLYDLLNLSYDTTNDPIEHDEELRKKLEENRKHDSKINEIIEKYAEKQEQGEDVAEVEDDEESTEASSDEDTDIIIAESLKNT